MKLRLFVVTKTTCGAAKTAVGKGLRCAVCKMTSCR
jgi:hypothetical protein